MKQTRPRLIIADDHPLLIEGLERLLGRRFTIVGVAHSGPALTALLRHLNADCLLLDLSMPGQGGLDLLPQVRQIQPALKVIIVTQYVSGVVADAAMSAGADGFVPKDSGSEELRDAIMAVLADEKYISPRVPRSAPPMALEPATAGAGGLTPRQREILKLIARGLSTANIAAELGLTQRAVEFHRNAIQRELGIDSARGLVRWAVMHRESAEEGAV